MSAEQTVLIAEDDADEAFLLMEAFRQAKLDHRLVWVRSGQEVLDYLSGKRLYDEPRKNAMPDLMVLDLRMPGIGGDGVLKWLQGEQGLKVPVVVLTSAMSEADEVRSRELGAKGYYVKPLDFNELVRLVRELDARWLKGEK
jgi:DNA-binding response OmpR family regulator